MDFVIACETLKRATPPFRATILLARFESVSFVYRPSGRQTRGSIYLRRSALIRKASVWNPLASVPVCPFPMRSIRFTWRVGRAASNLGDARDRIEHFGALKRTKLVPLREPEVLTRAHQHPDSNRWQPAQKSIQATLIHLFAHFDPCHNIANLGCNTSQPIVAPVTISLRA